MTDAVISFKGVDCRIAKQTILDGISFEVAVGQVIGILGPNGAGKTTLLSLVTGLRRHTTGEITVLGQRLPARDRRLAQKMGVVLQDTALYEELTTFENLRFAASLFNLKDSGKRISDVLQLLMLADRANQVVRTLSGGLRRRIAIARALLHDPQLLVIDEPTLGVDVEARHAIWSHLRLLRSKGTTILVSTNYLDEAQALCDTVAVLREGRLLTCETPDTLMAKTGNCLDVQCSDQSARIISDTLNSVPGVLRIEPVPGGVTVFVNSAAGSHEAMELILRQTDIDAVRRRAPDLAEVFKALGAGA